MSKIGVIAGAFDPMHNGHLGFINESIEKYGLDRVFVLIEKKSKHKQAYADFIHRKKIVELSIDANPKIELYETMSDSFPLSSTLPQIKEFADETYLLIGDDVKEHIKSWPYAEDLLKNVKLVVAKRGQDKAGRISSGKVREQIRTGSQRVDMQKDALDYCLKNGLYS